jgi:hypothetical protein
MKNEPIAKSAGDVLHWPGRVVTGFELARLLNGHRRLLVPANAVLTPSALDELRHRGISVEREQTAKPTRTEALWGIAQEEPQAAVASALKALAAQGLPLRSLEIPTEDSLSRWALRLASRVGQGEFAGAVAFCSQPALVCCVANKLAGLRAASIGQIGVLDRMLKTLAPNLVAVEISGRTFFEVRQILVAACARRECDHDVTSTLRELETHAHR